jgi:hypothetical protein
MMRLRVFQQDRSASAEEESQPSYGHHDPYDEAYGGSDVGSENEENEEEEWGDLEEAEVGLDQTHRDRQERMERKKGKKGKNKGQEGGRPEPGHKLKLLVWNLHGIGGRFADANAELKKLMFAAWSNYTILLC